MSKKLVKVVAGALLCSFVAGYNYSIPANAKILGQVEANKNVGIQLEKKMIYIKFPY